MKPFLALVALVCSTALAAQSLTPDMLLIKEAADARDWKKVLSFIGKDAALDNAALLALASVQADSTAPKILEMMLSPEKNVRIAAAFALGQTLRVSPNAKTYEPDALKKLSDERDESVKAELLNAVGLFGSEAALEEVASLGFKTERLRQAQAEALARFAIRNIASEKSVAKLIELYQATKKSASFNFAIYGLARVTTASLLGSAEKPLLDAITSRSADARMYAAVALGRVNTKASVDALAKATTDKDWRVAVSALRSLSNLYPEDAEKIYTSIQSLLQSTNYHLHKEALLALARRKSLSDATEKRASLIAQVESSLNATSPDLRAEAIRTLAQLAPEKAAVLISDAQKSNAVVPAHLTAVGLFAEKGASYQNFLPFLKMNMESKDPSLARAALQAWGRCWKLDKQKNTTDTLFESALLGALAFHVSASPQNTGAVQLIVSILVDSLHAQPKYAAPILNALKKIPSSSDVETVLELLDALGKLRDASVAEGVKIYASDDNAAVRKKASDVYYTLMETSLAVKDAPTRPADWTWLKKYPKKPTAILNTTKGEIELDLFINEATYTVKSFIELAEKNFYDGLLFHRVVSNFVVQGGDPRGDGTGGPPYSIRSEFTRHRYERGMLGMASAGKDTEGSQFFVMHAHHPHLDGRYTVFGKVVKGMDVVDKIEIGDKILSVKIR